ncbi:hypothetical protein SLEP1_g28385 [Rubroshorea leprosula]|uniref:Uncharacterized protein n=1 Tax=Rubroshorea leprosula TaxID=152421 RepID=A0AAV5K5U5_9ROSI|nr:hypothetical protein SLEP1_g28385 [Rubroshorea leprosula]
MIFASMRVRFFSKGSAAWEGLFATYRYFSNELHMGRCPCSLFINNSVPSTFSLVFCNRPIYRKVDWVEIG